MSDRPDFERADRPSTAQPAPVHQSGQPSVHSLVIRDLARRQEGHPEGLGRLAELMAERRAFGLRKYGTELQVNNGRDHTQDVLEELADALVYTRCAVEAGRTGARLVYEQLLEVSIQATLLWYRPPGTVAA